MTPKYLSTIKNISITIFKFRFDIFKFNNKYEIHISYVILKFANSLNVKVYHK